MSRDCFVRPLLRLLCVLLVWLLPTLGAAAETESPRSVADLMQDRKYDDAIKEIDKLLVDKATKSPEYLRYLKGRAQHLKQDYDAAIATFDSVTKDDKSSLAIRARFAKAVSLARKGDYRGAEVIYKAEAERVLSLDRKQEIANVYLEFADAYFKPTKIDQQPDYAKALEYYSKALEVGPQTEKRIELELKIAECQQRLGQHNQAIALLTRFIKDHPAHKLVIEARYRLGESYLAAGNRMDARRTWQDLLELHVDSPSPRVAEASFRLGETYGLPNPQDNEDLALGVAALQAFLEKFPEHKLAGPANLVVIQSYLQRGRHEDAVAAAKKFLADERYAKREEVPAARNLLGVAYKVQQKFDEALAVYAEFLAKHPTHQAWAQVQQEIINVEYLKAQAAFEAKKYDVARKLWEAFLAKYPLDARNANIHYRFGQMKFAEEKYDDAIAAWKQLVSKYPGSEEASLAQLMIGVTLEDKQGDLEEALKEFKKLNWGNHVSSAQQRVARLTAKNMAIATERVFRSGETPTLKLTTRNVETVTVRIYTVDLETYFRKMHLASGIEQLDISLIDPDSTFEFKVPDYKEHKEFISQIEVPLPKKGDAKGADAGVMAVTVSSKTLEATTLVLKSDLDIIVKSSRNEVFLFAQNLKTGKPWPNARLLIADGNQVFAEEKTGNDGVFHKSYQQLKDGADVRVFAISDRHVASNVVNLSGVGAAAGLENKGYVFTDRPAYRAGQMVQVRGIIRQTSGDKYTVAEGKKYRCEVFDVRNRLLYEAEVALNGFGSFHTNFNLPAAVPPGEYRIVVRDNDKENYAGSFLVHEYQLEPIRLEVQSERIVYYRGEEITGKIKASYYYGAPLVGKEIHYHLDDGRVETATTDDQGEIAFKLATREYRESQPLTLFVALPENSLSTGKTFFLATQAFSLSVDTVRDVYIQGETFEATVTAKDAEKKPLAEAVTLHVLKQTNVDGKTGEVEVAQHELKTDAKTGLARKTLRLDSGGAYILRVSGIDRFKNAITADGNVTISDDKDATRLRILADQHSYQVGADTSVTLHWRDEPALALVTFQGAKIIDYKLVNLQKGANKLPFAMTAGLAPNFDLAVSVMTDTRPDPKAKPDLDGKLPAIIRFHEATSNFKVERELKVKLGHKPSGDKKEILPGDEIEVTIETTDPQGKPLSAEVSLALIEQALLERFPWRVPAIHEFFRDQERQSAMRTTSSVTFAYQPATRSINPQLLAEKDRLEIEAEEQTRRTALAEANNPVSDPFGDPAPAGERPLVTSVIPALPAMEIDATAFHDSPLAYSNAGDGRFMFGIGNFAGSGLNGRGQATKNSKVQSAGGRSSGGQRDFDALIDRISSTESVTWSDRRTGQGTIAPFPTNLSIAVSQTQEVVNGLQSAMASAKQDPKLGKLQLDHYYSFQANDVSTNGERVRLMYENNLGDVQLLLTDGTVANFNPNVYLGARFDQAKADKVAAELKQAGAVMLPQGMPSETAYWNPAIVTNAKGQATIKLTLPERSTAWTLLARGITVETLAGEAEDKFAVKKDLFGQLKLPLAFTDGDKANVIASIHNEALDKGEVGVSLKLTLGGKTTTLTKKVKIEKKGIVDVSFEQELKLAEDAVKHGAPTSMAEFELVITAGEKKDVVKRSVPVQPYGVPVYAIRGGSAQGDATIGVAQPKGMTLVAPRLQVVIGPTVDRSLLDALFAPPTWCQIDAVRLAASTDSATSDLMAALALQKLEGNSREANNPQATEIDARIRSSLVLLAATQNEDGGWSWTGTSGGSNRYETARVLWAISLAKTAGYRLGGEHAKAIHFLQQQMAAAGAADYETRAVLLHALTAAGKEDVTVLNQLYRNRQSLSAAATVHLALTYVDMDRKQTAAEMLTLLDKVDLDNERLTGNLSWNQSTTELRAMYALALEAVAPADAKLQAQVDWLLAHRVGHRWSPDKATGPAMLALSKWFSRTKFASEKYKLVVYVNDVLEKEIEITPDARTQTIDVSNKHLKADKKEQTVHFELQGRGRYTYQVILGGFVPSDKLVSTTPAWKVERFYEPAPLELFGQSIPRGFNVVAGPVQPFRNELHQLPVAKRGRVELRITRPGLAQNTPDHELEYLVVTEPVPAGAAVIENSIHGNFERYEIGPGSITFYVGSQRDNHKQAQVSASEERILEILGSPARSFEFFEAPLTEVVSRLKEDHEIPIVIDEKAFAAAAIGTDTLITKNLKGITLRSALKLMLKDHALSFAIKDEVLIITTQEQVDNNPDYRAANADTVPDFAIAGGSGAAGAISYDVHGYLPGDYRTTPTIVRNAYRPDQMAVAKVKDLKVLALGQKSPDKYQLTPRELYELGKRHFDKGQLAEAAPHLNELYTQWSLGGEFYKDTVRMLLDVNLAANKPAEVVKYFEIIIEKFPDVELPFAKFMQAGDAYHKVGEYERSYLVFRAVIEASFLRESRVAGFLEGQGEFLRSVEVMSKLLAEYPSEPYVAAATYALAQNIYAKAPQAAADMKLREKHVTRIDLIQQARQRLDKFLTEHPDDPAADEASFSLASALLDMELYDKAIERAARYAVRYPSSNFLDTYWYIIGFCHFARGEHDEALAMCQKVVESTRMDESGRRTESPNKWRALYIIGQIYHSLGEAEKAIEYYTRVNERFEDAREAIEFFTQKSIKLPDVTSQKPGDAAPLELKFRNVASVDVTVYRIDLMKFSLLRKSLAEITQINLAGIRPIHEENVKLGDGKDFREKTAKLDLPLKEEGAYLVVARGENLHASGMVVVSPLVLEIQEEQSAGRVRTTVRDVVKDAYVSNVHVKTIGNRNSDFVSGETDLRGIHVADGIQGTAMVIAQAGPGRYAFYRGTRDLGPQPTANAAPSQQLSEKTASPRLPAKGGKEALLDDLKTYNSKIQGEQQKELKNVYDNGIQGGFGGGLGGGVF
jgi:uncharacterized protein YfaS (alpha-2-macroglobulin family)/tetratricopeptide (TPR) repeat protein